MTDLAHGDRNRYLRGPDENDTPGKGCRCAPCTAASTKYKGRRQLLIARGQWQPWVDADLVRAHVAMLKSAGLGYSRVAQIAGVAVSTLVHILNGRDGYPPPTKVRREPAAKILAVRPSLDHLAPRTPLDATGAHRRMQALVALGHSRANLARRLGMTNANFLIFMQRDRITAATHRAVCALYDELWNVAPDESDGRTRAAVTRSRNIARANGWAPPMAWDDDKIDDPAAGPAGDWQRPKRLSPADRAEEVAELLARYDGNRLLAADHLGVSRSAIEKTIERAGRAS